MNDKIFHPEYETERFEVIYCSDKSIGIALTSIDKYASKIFHLFSKYYNLFQNSIDYQKQKNNIRDFILNTEFNSALKEIPITTYSDFIRIISNTIKNSNVVFIIQNLEHLFYSSHYLEEFQIHFSLIVNESCTKNLYYLYDGEQKSTDKHIYDYFSVPRNIVYKAFQKASSVNLIYTLNLSEVQFNLISSIKKLLILLKNNNECKEKNIFDTNIKYLSSDKKIYEIVRLNNEKKYFFSTLSELFFDTFSIQNENKITIENKIDILEKLREKLLLKMSSSIINPKRKFDYSIFDDILKLENEIIDDFNILIYNSDSTEHIIFHDDNYCVENDQDHIIKKANNNIIFSFHNNKIYDCWVKDDAPKIILKEKKDSFSLEFDVVSNISYTTNYHCGLYIEDTDQHKYFCGPINENVSIIKFYKMGHHINYEYKNMFEYPGEISIKAVYKNNILSIYILENNNYIEMLTTEILEIKKIGFSCKTWNGYDPIDIKISNIKFLDC